MNTIETAQTLLPRRHGTHFLVNVKLRHFITGARACVCQCELHLHIAVVNCVCGVTVKSLYLNRV